jgi:hypothetical protein
MSFRGSLGHMKNLRLFLTVAMSGLFAGACGGTTIEQTPEALATDVRTCGAPSPCPQFFFEDCGTLPCTPTMYMDNQVCTLEALGKGERALVDISIGCEGGCVGSYLLLRGDGTVVDQPYFDDAGERKLSTPSICKLTNAAYFEACVQAFDPACLNTSEWLSECAEAASFTCQ